MANPEQPEEPISEAKQEDLETLLSGWEAWNNFRSTRSGTIDLSGVDIGTAIRRTTGLSHDDVVPLQGMDMHDVDLSGATLKGIVFTGVYLRCANLKNADLSFSKFPGSDLMNACLSSAYLFRTDFRGANLTGVDFGGCDLRPTLLTGADLSCSRLFLASSIVNDVEFNRTQVAIRDEFKGSHIEYLKWREKTVKRLYEFARRESHEIPDDDDIRRLVRLEGWSHLPIPENVVTVESVQQLLSVLDDIQFDYRHTFDPDVIRFYYRGEESNEWPLTHSLHRKIKNGSEAGMVRELMTRVPEEFGDAESLFDRLVLAQQNGLPTRLLDVTRNPLVALYFALQQTNTKHIDRCNQKARIHVFATPVAMIRRHDDDDVNVAAAISELSTLEQDVILTCCFEWRNDPPRDRSMVHDDHSLPSYLEVIQKCADLLSPTKPYLSNQIDPKTFFGVYLVEPKRALDRLRAQSGAFILSAYHRRFEQKMVAKVDASARIYDHHTIHIDISEQSRERMLEQLSNMNINQETLFPGLESSAKAIMAQHAKPSSEEKPECCDRECDA